MKNKYIALIILVVVVAIGAFAYSTNKISLNFNGSVEEKTNENTPTDTTDTKGTTVKTTKTNTVKVPATQTKTLPEIEFINPVLSFNLANYDKVKFTIERVAFGRGDASTSTGCQGIPNTNFSTYLYPGSGICLGDAKVDGANRGIVAFHILIENNGQYGFGGDSNALKLHYLRSGSGGEITHRFAYPLNGLASYYLNPFSSKVVILSYLVPEDQRVFDLLVNYKAPSLENQTLNVYSNSTNGLLADFNSKSLKLVK